MKRILAGLLFSTLTLSAQTHTLVTVPFEGNAPAPRQDGVVTWDSAANRLYMFGGVAGEVLGDLWTFNIARQQWTAIETPGIAPARRFGHTMVFDSRRNRLVVFGGQSSGFFSDVWSFDTATGGWSKLAADGSGPSSRYGHSAVYDPRQDRMIISHGFTTAGRFDDTWAFSLATNRWTNITPAGTKPLKRCLQHAVLDEAGNAMYLYGGCSSGFGPCPQDDLWAFDLERATWQQMTTSTRPPGRYQNGMAFDAARRRVVIYGGVGSTSLNDIWLNDIWEFDVAARQWQQATTSATPPARTRVQGVAAGGDVYFFGGGLPLSRDLLRLRVTAPPVISGVRNAFSGASGVLAPGGIASLYGERLGPTSGLAGEFVNGRLTMNLADVSVTVNGEVAPLYYAGSGQINFQTPYETAPGPATVVVRGAGGVTVTSTARVDRVAPGMWNGALNEDLTLNGAASPASAGSVVVLFATGAGNSTPSQATGQVFAGAAEARSAESVVVRIGGAEAEILYAGPVAGTAGVLQVNARVPRSLSAGPAAVTMTVGGVAAQDGVALIVR